MTLYMLDTNTLSHLVTKHPLVTRKVANAPLSSLRISSITEGELLFGLAKRRAVASLQAAVRDLLRSIEVLPWDSAAAECYGDLRAAAEQRGHPLGSLDMLIAAHALSIDAVLATSDQAFRRLPELQVEDWTIA